MEHAIERAPELRLATYLAFVFAHNGPSLALCRKFGFEQWGTCLELPSSTERIATC
jgi:phosphinothricin acetyltransferase